jgi:hypothetical protein
MWIHNYVHFSLLYPIVRQDEELKLKKDKFALEELTSRRRTLGNIRFIGELFKLKVCLSYINEKIGALNYMYSTMKRFIKIMLISQ